MKQSNRFTLPAIIIFIALFIILGSSCKTKKESNDFTFAFLTDIHIQPELNAVEGFRKAISVVDSLKPDFVITGGDLIMDALGVPLERASSLYDLYIKSAEGLEMPVYNTMGNHEVFGYYEGSGVESEHPLYGDKLFESKMGKRYYHFDHKGWRFYILDAIDEKEEGGYYGYVDNEQMEWLREDLARVDTATPIVISVHIPLITVQTQILKGATEPNSAGLVITNSKDVLDLFADHNLKLVLQGHLHNYEDIYYRGTHFITGGAVSGNWWKGAFRGIEEGFLLVSVEDGEISARYVDYGWNPNL